MPDIYIECIIKHKASLKGLPMAVLCFAAGAAISLLVIMFAAMFIYLVPVILFVALWFAYRFVTAGNFEYEYILTNTELDIDRIMARRSRRRELNVNCRNFEMFAPYDGEILKGQDIKKTFDMSSGYESDGKWIAVYNSNAGRTALIIEPDERMLEAFKGFLPKKVMPSKSSK